MTPSWKALGVSIAVHAALLSVGVPVSSSVAEEVSPQIKERSYVPVLGHEIACTNERLLRNVLMQWVPLDEEGCTMLPEGYIPETMLVIGTAPGLCDFDVAEQPVPCPAQIIIVQTIDRERMFFAADGWAEQLPLDVVEDLEYAKSLPVGVPCAKGACALAPSVPDQEHRISGGKQDRLKSRSMKGIIASLEVTVD